jgi:hypothetical protein
MRPYREAPSPMGASFLLLKVELVKPLRNGIYTVLGVNGHLDLLSLEV